MSSTVNLCTLDNGLTLVAERREHVSSAAFAMLVGLGASTDPASELGSASIMSEMFNRGAGSWTSRQLSEHFENLGAQRGHSAGTEVSVFSSSGLGSKLPEILSSYSTVLLEPTFPAPELESVRSLALQELESLEDEPASKVMVELAKAYYPGVHGRPQMGTVEGVTAVSADSLRAYYDTCFKPNDSILGVAGNFDWNELRETVTSAFGSWEGSCERPTVGELPSASSVHHIERDTAQLQIALAYQTAAIDDPDYYAARVGVGILSGGMSGRLFIEVREKRGLVYSVRASHSAPKGRAGIFCYAGTTPENGEETLQVMLQELRGLQNNITDEELGRAKADIKSRLVMQSEASSSRASQLVNDYWSLGRIRDIEEIKGAIDAVSAEDIARVCERFPASVITLSTIGPKKLEIPQ